MPISTYQEDVYSSFIYLHIHLFIFFTVRILVEQNKNDVIPKSENKYRLNSGHQEKQVTQKSEKSTVAVAVNQGIKSNTQYGGIFQSLD